MMKPDAERSDSDDPEDAPDRMDESANLELADSLDRARDALVAGDPRPLLSLFEITRGGAFDHLAQLQPKVLSPRLEVGARIGDFLISGLLGEGGMGVVYRAEQERPRRSVALKVMREQLDSSEWETRQFGREGDALARLQHPFIVKVYAAGVLADSRPWIAMEYVVGSPLDRWWARNPDLPSRLALFRDVAIALQHAHLRGVIHRDLKPSNILVGEDGRPRVLDFGLAKFIDRGAKDSLPSMATRLLGTLSWMSPEQVDGGDADARSDVYALGLILYHLVTGVAPYRIDTGKPLEAIKTIHGTAPARHPKLTGDLEIVVMKALRKDKEQRYRSAHDLGEDVERVRLGRPIDGRTQTLRELLREVTRRHPRAMLAGSLAIVAIVIALVVTTFALRRANSDRKRAEAILRVLERAFTTADPNLPGSGNRPLDQYVDDIVAGIDKDPDIDLAVRSDVRSFAGRLYTSLDRAHDALPLLHTALDSEPQVGFDARRHGVLLRDIGFAAHADEQFEEAEKYKREALRFRLENFDPSDKDVVQSRDELADLLRDTGRFDDARSLLAENVRIMSGVGRLDATAEALRKVALNEFAAGEPKVALEAMRKARATLESDPNANLATRARLMLDVASVEADAVSFEAGIDLIDEVLRQLNDSPEIPQGLLVIATWRRALYTLEARGPDLALFDADAALHKAENLYGESSYMARICRDTLAHLRHNQGNFDEEVKLCRRSFDLAARDHLNGSEWRIAARTLVNAYIDHQHYDGALKLATTVDSSITGSRYNDRVAAYETKSLLADVYEARREFDRSIATKIDALEIAKQLQPNGGSRVAAAEMALAQRYLDHGHVDLALPLARHAHETTLRTHSEGSIGVAVVRIQLAVALFRSGENREAEDLAARGLAVICKIRGPNSADCRNNTAAIEQARASAKK